MFKKLIITLFLATSIWAQTSTNFSGGGTANSPFLIQNADNLALLATLVNANTGTYRSAHYRLTANIDLAHIPNWTPIGNESRPFGGVFNGNGYAISNLTITGNSDDRGLFGIISHQNAVVRELALVDVDITGNEFVGGIVGGIGDGIIENCFVSGRIAGRIVGGIVGGIFDRAIVRTSISTVLISTNFVGGGIIGSAISNINNTTILNNVALNQSITSANFIGRVVGMNNSTLSENHAWSGMQAIGGIAFGTGEHNNRNGRDVASLQVLRADWWENNGFGSTIWVLENGKLPSIRGRNVFYVPCYIAGCRWGDYIPDGNATCIDKGTKTKTCGVCGATDTQTGDEFAPCTKHVCTDCGKTCDKLPHICNDPLCNRTATCGAHTCVICGIECVLHVCELCGKSCPDKCACEICDCDCVNKSCHDCGDCADCKPELVCDVCGDYRCEKEHKRCIFCEEWDCTKTHTPCPGDPKCDKGFDCTCQAVSIVNVDASTSSATGIRFAVNPVSDVAEISVVLPASTASTGSATAATEVSVVIYDVAGNVVFACKGTACLARSSSADKANLVLTWDLRNNTGRFVANGTYLVIAEVKDRNGRTHRYSAKLGVRR